MRTNTHSLIIVDKFSVVSTMTDKKSDKMSNSSKPVPMKLFAAWEVDRTPSNCIPRLCTLTVSRLRVSGGVLGAAEPASSLSLAVRMLSSKRTLRSNDIATPTAPGVPLDVELDLNFSLQYPHFVKRDGNRLQIMLQRRKKYKNRTILGYKTLAEGTIRMDQVLQKQMDMELELCAEASGKGGDKSGAAMAAASGVVVGGAPIATGGSSIGRDAGVGNTPSGLLGVPLARITITGLSSTPVDHDTKNNNTLVITDRLYSDEEEEAEFSSVEENDDGAIGLGYAADRQRAYNKRDMSYSKQRNLKQKFAALLRRFKVPDELAERGAGRAGAVLDDGDREIDELIQEWESMSCGEGDDSGPEIADTISIGSTPKPSLRPFFSSSRSLAISAGGQSGVASSARGTSERRSGDENARYSVDGARNMYMAKTNGKVAGGGRRRQHSRITRSSQATTGTNAPHWQRVDTSVQTVPQKSIATIITDIEGMRLSGSDRLAANERTEGSATSDCDQDTQYSSSEYPISPAVTLSASPPKEKDEKQRSRLFRSGNSVANIQSGAISKKKNSLGLISADHRQPTYDVALLQTITEQRKPIGEQLCKALPTDESVLPDALAIVLPSSSLPTGLASTAVAALNMASVPTVALPSVADVRHVMNAILNRIHKHCNLSAKAVQPVRVVLAGADSLVAAVLRSYCDLWARRPPDWASYIRFYLIPMGPNSTSRHIASIDPGYAVLFSSDSWSTLLERCTIEPTPNDVSDICARITRYVKNTGPVIQLPVAEAMIAYRDKATDEESNQTFVPFISDVRIGTTCVEGPNMASVETEDAGGSPRASPPATPAPISANPISISSVGGNTIGNNDSLVTAVRRHHITENEAHELQIDYWQVVRPSEANRNMSGGLNTSGIGSGLTSSSVAPPDKNTLKSAFRSMQVSRTHANDGSVLPAFTIVYCTKEKKQKIMRLGKKKEKDRDSDSSKSQTVEGVSRLICSSKVSHNVPLRVYIDGVEWNSVKFFQLSTQWQTHVKNFPMALTGAPLAPEELS